MRRRTLLAGTAALATAALAGCLGESPGSDGDTSKSPAGTDSPALTDSAPSTPALSESTFAVETITPGGGENAASVSFGDGVTVTGTIVGNNGCYTAELASAELAEGTLTVVVEAVEEKSEDEMCTQALVDVDYEAAFTFEGGLPERVVVRHVSMGETRTVAEQTR